MTENETQIRRAIATVQSTFPSGGGDWSRKRFEAWVSAIGDLDGAAVEEGAIRLVREWSDERGRIPYPGHLRETVKAVMRARDDEQPAVSYQHPTGYEPTPAWFARLVMAGICIRNGVTAGGLTQPYVEILREFDLDREPSWGSDDPISAAVFAAARDRAAVSQEMGEARPALIGELVPVSKVADEPWPRGPRNGGV